MATALATATPAYKVPPQVLVMEDDLTLANGLKMVLDEDGLAVDLAGTGELAMEAFRQKRFDLLVADLRLPDINGMDVIREIKANKPETEIIVITGHGNAATAVEAMKLGVSDFIPKPFTEGQIKAAISEALKHVEKEVAADNTVAEPATEEERLIQKREVIQVLNRTWEDGDFWTDLMENGSEALTEYRLSSQARAAITSGDLKWINENVGELTQKQLLFIYKRLEREAW